MHDPQPPRPPAPRLRRATRRSYQTLTPDDLEAARDALRRLGAVEGRPANNEHARLHWRGGLALLYTSGRIVAAGDDPAPLLEQLAEWAAATPAPQAGQRFLFDKLGRKGAA